MKILHVAYGYPPKWLRCGPVVYLHSLALAQRAGGDEVVVVSASDENVPDRPAFDPAVVGVDGIAYVPLRNRPVVEHDFLNPLREVHDEACERAFTHILSEVQPDVVHVHNLVGLSLDVLLAAQRCGAAVVMSLHNYFPLCSRDDLFFANAQACAGAHRRSCGRCLGTLVNDRDYRTRLSSGVAALNKCDLLLAVSERVAEIYRDHGVAADRIAVEHIGSDTAEGLWRVGGEQRTRQAGAARQSPVGEEVRVERLRVVFFGASVARKGLMTLLQALRFLAHPERIDVHVYAGADAQHVEVLNSLVTPGDPAQTPPVTVHGAYAQSDLFHILPSMDVAVITPRWEDNGPQTVMEALGAGLPVVATRMGGIPDFVVDGVNGVLVDEGDVEGLAAVLDRLSQFPDVVAQLRRNIAPPRTIEEHRAALDDLYRTASLRRARALATRGFSALRPAAAS